jgi:hypothetical protein
LRNRNVNLSKKMCSVLTYEHPLSWDRRRLACTEREARKTSDAGETPAVPGKSIRKSARDKKMLLTQNRKILLAGIVLVCLVFVPAQAQDQRPATRGNSDESQIGSINGSAVNEAGQPLAGVVVFVRDTSAGGVPRSTITNAEGNFRLNALVPGLYLVSGFLPAYVIDPVDPNLPTSRFRVGDTVRLELIRGGVITGTVRNSVGEPLIGVRVRAMMVRGTKGETPLFYVSGEQSTDDRGVYRMYGLAPGTYVISAGGGSSQPFQITAFDSDIPTYAPSATRDNALEVEVRPGEENNVDVRYRGEPGHAISGTVKLTTNGGSTVTVLMPNTYVPVGTTFQGMGNRGFAFYGMADGEYDLIAQEITQVPGSQTPQLSISERKRVVVKGADVTGLELVPRSLPSMNGRIVLEPSKAEACQGKRRPLFAETFVALERPDEDKKKDTLTFMRVLSGSGAPDEKGNFFIRNLAPGRYLFDPHFHARYWYLDSISVGGPTKVDAAANWTTLKSGEQLGAVTITLAEGAASVRGRLTAAEAAELPTGLGVYLIPAERERATDVLRYFVAPVEADGTFSFNNLPPGRYLTLQQTLDPPTSTVAKLRLPESAEARTKLRRSAETQQTELQLKPCQNLTEYKLTVKQ